MSPILQTNVPGMGVADIHSPSMFLTLKTQKPRISDRNTQRVMEESKNRDLVQFLAAKGECIPAVQLYHDPD